MSDTENITVTARAFQYKGDLSKLPADFKPAVQAEYGTENCLVQIPTGTKLCKPGDYIIQAPDESFMVLSATQFEALKKQIG